ncbi:MAG: GNAT family N-acetyltransferase [Acidimicrobiia bacterium]|nr:GNAT family N-acetyltransferase [Acidimicrobiia bacterium]
MLTGDSVLLRVAVEADVPILASIRAEPEVHARWRGDNLAQEVADSIASDELTVYVVELHGEAIGAIQSYEETDRDYRHAGIDIYLAPQFHGKGLGSDAVRTLVRHLLAVEGHHRIVIDPAADNEPAIAAYRKVGFRVVGTMRQYERGDDGQWHDGVLMELLADDFEAAP